MTQQTAVPLARFASQLMMKELLQFTGLFLADSLTLDNVFDFLHQAVSMENHQLVEVCKQSQFRDLQLSKTCVQLIANNFGALCEEDFSTFPVNIMHSIVQSEQLNVLQVKVVCSDCVMSINTVGRSTIYSQLFSNTFKA